MLSTTSRRKQQNPAQSQATRRKVRGLTEDQEQEAREAFSLFDPHQTNHISYHELKVILRALGFEVKKSEVNQLAK